MLAYLLDLVLSKIFIWYFGYTHTVCISILEHTQMYICLDPNESRNML